MSGPSVEDLPGSENAPRDNLMTGPCHCTFAQTNRLFKKKKNGIRK